MKRKRKIERKGRRKRKVCEIVQVLNIKLDFCVVRSFEKGFL